MARFGLLVKMTAAAGQGYALIKIMKEAATLMKEAPGCDSYVVHAAADDNDIIWITEIWRDEQSHEQSLSVEGVGELIGQARPMIGGMEMTKLRTLTD